MPASDANATQDSALPAIPVLDVGEDYALATIELARERVDALLDAATAYIPTVVLRLADRVSRRWLVHSGNPHLAEIDRIAERLGRPGAHYFNISYEWGCTSGVGTCPERGTPRLVRVLDWPTAGLGRNVVAARVAGQAGRWTTLTWPGYSGVLQAMAPGRFSAALNQAPMAQPVGLLAVDWALNRRRVWNHPHLTPAHLLRRVFETAGGYAEAKRLLSETPVSSPVIYSLAGTSEGEACIVERLESEAHVIEGPAAAVNAWQNPDWSGRPRARQNTERCRMMQGLVGDVLTGFAWLQPPIRNRLTRLAVIANPAAGEIRARGYEKDGPATQVLMV